MAIVPLTLPTTSAGTRYTMEGDPRLINCYAEQTGSGAKSPQTIYAMSGLDLWTTVQNGGTSSGPTGVRAFCATEDYLYVVAGRKVTAIDKLGVKTLVVTLPGDGEVYLARNRRSPDPQVGLVSDGTFRVITGTSIATVTDPDLPPPVALGVSDGYHLLPTTFGRMFITGEDNATTVSALDFGRAQKQPGELLYSLGAERDVIQFTTQGIEWWTNSPDGSGNFPYVPVANITLGCIGAKTVVQLDRAVAWMASDYTVRLMDGYSGKRISDHAQERDFHAPVGTVYGFGWNDTSTGHAWLCWRCETWAWAYNLRTGMWSELKESGSRTTWRGCQAISWQGDTLIGDYEDGRIYRVDYKVNNWGGDPFTLEVNLASAHDFPHKMRLNAVYVDAVTGVGLASPLPKIGDEIGWDSEPIGWELEAFGWLENLDTPYENEFPALMLATSADGGRTFTQNRHLNLGKSGDRIRRLRSYRFGQFSTPGCTLRVSCSASVARAISGVSIDVDKLK